MFAVALLAAFTLPADNPLPTGKPNIVMIMVDDLDVLTMDTMRKNGLLPSFEQYIGKQAVEFRQSFVTNSLCCPSRATYLTGQYTHNHKTYTTGFWNGLVISLDDRSTLPVWLQQSGYTTGHVGKYLNGYGSLSAQSPDTLTSQRAFWDGRVGQQNRYKLEATYIPPGWSEWYGVLDTWTYCVYNYLINENRSVRSYRKTGEVVENGVVTNPNTNIPGNYQTDVLAIRAKSFVERNASRPFFLSVTPLAPHVEECKLSNSVYGDTGPTLPSEDYTGLFSGTIRPAPRHLNAANSLLPLARQIMLSQATFNEADISDKPLEMRQTRQLLTSTQIDGVAKQFADRMGAMMAVDNLIGTIGAQLSASKVLDNTIIVFTSDNGWFYGAHRLSSKDLAYDESIRVPLYVRLPGKTPALSTELSFRTVVNNDLAPTIAGLAGATAPDTVDGRSFVPLLVAPGTATWRKRFLVEHYLSGWDDEPGRSVDRYSFSAVRTSDEAPRVPHRLYVEYFGGLQLQNGWYPTRPPFDQFYLPTTSPGAPNVMLTPPIDAEFYNRDVDPIEEENLLYMQSTRPNTAQITSDTNELRAVMKALVKCAGSVCRGIEFQ